MFHLFSLFFTLSPLPCHRRNKKKGLSLRSLSQNIALSKKRKKLSPSLLLPLPRLELDARALHPHPLPLVRARPPQRDHVGRGLRHQVLVQAPEAHQRRLRDDGPERGRERVGAVVRVAELEREGGAVRGQGRAVADADDAELDVEALGDALVEGGREGIEGKRGEERLVGVERKESDDDDNDGGDENPNSILTSILFLSRVCSVPKKGLLTLATSIERPSGESLSAPSPRPSSDARSVFDVPSGPVTVSSLPFLVTETLGGTSMDATLRSAGAAR